jgi:hypothetical protein
MIGKLTGTYCVWNLLGHARMYADITIPYSDAVQYVMAVRYNALTGKGEQREIFDAHCKKLKREMEEGNFTPTQVSAGLRKSHRDNLKLDEKNLTFVLKVDSDDPLPQTDGGHRGEAIARILKGLTQKLEAAEGEDKVKIQGQIDALEALPVGIRIYFDGNPQKDFTNLQAGRTVDKAHMLSLRIQQKVLDDPSFKVAFEVAKLLNKTEGSPVQNSIRFDSRGVAPLPISTLCQKAGSDIATSLIGTAKIGLFGDKPADSTFLAHCVMKTFKSLTAKAPELLEAGKVLTPIGNSGTKGSATLMIGLANCLAYRVRMGGKSLPSDRDVAQAVDAAKETLDREVAGNFSGPVKRSLMGKFAKQYFADLECDKHQGVPVGLIQILSSSTFGVDPLPKAPKATKTKAKAKPKKGTKALPDVDGPVVVTNEPEVVIAEPVVAVAEPVVVPVPEPKVVVEETLPSGFEAVSVSVAPWESAGEAVWESEVQA